MTSAPTAAHIIVCVDDHQSVLTMVARCLRRDGLEVRTTMDAGDALRWIANEQVAVLITDYDMPEMTGAQLANQARRIRPETVRILLTGHHTFATALDGINQGEVFRFIAKPFEKVALTLAVDAAIERHAELVLLGDDRRRHVRRAALLDALEAEHPGISAIALDDEGRFVATADPEEAARELGFRAPDRVR